MKPRQANPFGGVLPGKSETGSRLCGQSHNGRLPDQTISPFLRKLWLTDGLLLAHRLRYRSTRTAMLAAGVGLCLLSLGGTNWIAYQRSLLQPQPDRSLSSSAEADPTTFTAEELQQLQRRFGVHGPQPKLAQLFTRGVDQLTPLRNHTVNRLDALRPVVLRESRRTGINPMLLAAILFDEMQHAKPGEDIPLAAHSGLFSTHGPAQLGLSEMVKQGLLREDASPEELADARNQLLDPERNVELLAGKMARLLDLLNQTPNSTFNVSQSRSRAKTVATLAYLHNGKLDYPARILRYMQDPELHGLMFSVRNKPAAALI